MSEKHSLLNLSFKEGLCRQSTGVLDAAGLELNLGTSRPWKNLSQQLTHQFLVCDWLLLVTLLILVSILVVKGWDQSIGGTEQGALFLEVN